MTSCERPLKSSASDLGPSVVSKVYSFSTGTQGSCRRRSASSSLRRVSSFSFASSSSRAPCHSSCVPILYSVIVHSCLGGYLGRKIVPLGPFLLLPWVVSYDPSIRMLALRPTVLLGAISRCSALSGTRRAASSPKPTAAL